MDEQRIEDIVAMLDSLSESGSGHMSVEVKEGAEDLAVEQMGCLDCAKGNLACAVPTLHEGIDEAEDQKSVKAVAYAAFTNKKYFVTVRV